MIAIATTNATESPDVPTRLPAKVVRQPPVTIDTLLSRQEFVLFAKHMMHGNPISHFLTVWKDEKTGEACYAKARSHKRADQHASWTYDTITGTAKRQTSMGVYAKNAANRSTFAALDFDAHEHDQDELAKSRSIRAFTLLLEYRDRYLILSASGRGYHIFIFAREPRPVEEWVTVLKDTADTVGAPLEAGSCELFPNEKTPTQAVGPAIRVPGSLNPNTGEVELILADTIRPLIDQLKVNEEAEKAEKSATLRSKTVSPSALLRDKEAESSFDKCFQALSTKRLIDEVLVKHPIKRKGTRRGVLLKLAGELFRKFGSQLSERIVAQHYQLYRDNVRTSLVEHMRQFRAMWRSFRAKEEKQLSDSERASFDELKSDPQREGFFLCRSFAKFKTNFPLSQRSFGDRLSITQRGAGYVIAQLVEAASIKLTIPAKTNSSSACYAWIAGTPEKRKQVT
jgi:hypothetical protein